MSKSPAELLEAILCEKYSPVTPWAYHWTVKFADLPNSDALRIRLTWWIGCGNAEVHNIENMALVPRNPVTNVMDVAGWASGLECQGRANAMLRDMAASFLHKGR